MQAGIACAMRMPAQKRHRLHHMGMQGKHRLRHVDQSYRIGVLAEVGTQFCPGPSGGPTRLIRGWVKSLHLSVNISSYLELYLSRSKCSSLGCPNEAALTDTRQRSTLPQPAHARPQLPALPGKAGYNARVRSQRLTAGCVRRNGGV